MADEQQNGFHKVESHLPSESIPMSTLLTSDMGKGGSLFDSATKIGPALREGWPSIGEGTPEDRQWVLRVFSTDHYWRLGAKPDLTRIVFMKWILNPGVGGKRAEQLINAYAYGTSPAPQSEDGQQKPRRGILRR